MKNLTDWFDRVYVINCNHRNDRLQLVKDHFEKTGIADKDLVYFYPAVYGQWVTTPADWASGAGAWGCLRSHQRILEDVMHSRDSRGEISLDRILILEDDVIFKEDALENLNIFMGDLPSDWDQIYLGGQHRRDPDKTDSPNVIIGNSINRTHAYGLSRGVYEKFYRHISYATDYKNTVKHIDHQLEMAHRRKDWKVYCPKEWLCGQREGLSDINCKTHKANYWEL